MKVKSFKNFIVTDNDNKPMTFSKSNGQLVYCNDEFWKDDVTAIKPVTYEAGSKQIKKTIQFRMNNGFDVGQYKLMPIAYIKMKEKRNAV